MCERTKMNMNESELERAGEREREREREREIVCMLVFMCIGLIKKDRDKVHHSKRASGRSRGKESRSRNLDHSRWSDGQRGT